MQMSAAPPETIALLDLVVVVLAGVVIFIVAIDPFRDSGRLRRFVKRAARAVRNATRPLRRRQ